MNPNGTLLPLVERIRSRALVVGVAGAAPCVARGRSSTATLRPGVPLLVHLLPRALAGSLALLMLHRQLGGAWGFLLRRPLEPAAMTIPLMAVLFIPILVDLDRIYPWVNHPGLGEDHRPRRPGRPTSPRPREPGQGAGALGRAVGHPPRADRESRRPTLRLQEAGGSTPVDFTVRVAIYFTIWIILAMILMIGSRRQDETGSTTWPTASRASAPRAWCSTS